MGGNMPSEGAEAPPAALPEIRESSDLSVGNAGWVSGLARPPTTAVICVRRRSLASSREHPNKSNDTIPPSTSGRPQSSIRTGTRRRLKPCGSARYTDCHSVVPYTDERYCPESMASIRVDLSIPSRI